jgi:hypothetical protein
MNEESEECGMFDLNFFDNNLDFFGAIPLFLKHLHDVLETRELLKKI